MSDVILAIEGLGKRYSLRYQTHRPYTALRDVIASRTVAPIRALSTKLKEWKSQDRASHSSTETPLASRGSMQDFWALRNVSFEVRKGEVLGIIGRNGAGKSTLLKVLSRITDPTEGRVRIRGRVASLLEVGTGFHPELTGRENIYLNGAILGMQQREIKQKFDEIVAFAEVERFLDTPVKRYSSGMYVRLAFAVAAHLEPEILIVDEVLAVGDAEFQKKCIGKMHQVAEGEGRTVLFVSHNMSAVRNLCRKGIVLDSGLKCFDGGASDAIDFYSNKSASQGANWVSTDRVCTSALTFVKIQVALEKGLSRLRCAVTLRCWRNCPNAFIAVDVCDRTLTPFMQALPETNPFIRGFPGLHQVDLEIDLPRLIPGIYVLDFWIGSTFTETLDHIRQALSFEITSSSAKGRNFPHTLDHGCIVPESRINRYDTSASDCITAVKA